MVALLEVRLFAEDSSVMVVLKILELRMSTSSSSTPEIVPPVIVALSMVAEVKFALVVTVRSSISTVFASMKSRYEFDA